MAKKITILLQFRYYLRLIFYLPILPYLSRSGKLVRSKIPKLREASVNIIGTHSIGDGLIRVVLLGESHIAGIGIRDHKDGLAGQFSQALSALTGKAVAWNVIAQSGFTAANVTRDLVPQLKKLEFEIILIGLGGNDSFKLTSPAIWRKDIHELIESIRKTHPEIPIYFANLPPVGDFPAFPILMQKFLDGHKELLRITLISLVKDYSNVHFFKKVIRLEDWIHDLENDLQAKDFFRDGVHPSKRTYEIWGKIMAEKVAADLKEISATDYTNSTD